MTGSLDVYVENLDQKRMKLMLTWKNILCMQKTLPLEQKGKRRELAQRLYGGWTMSECPSEVDCFLRESMEWISCSNVWIGYKAWLGMGQVVEWNRV